MNIYYLAVSAFAISLLSPLAKAQEKAAETIAIPRDQAGLPICPGGMTKDRCWALATPVLPHLGIGPIVNNGMIINPRVLDRIGLWDQVTIRRQ